MALRFWKPGTAPPPEAAERGGAGIEEGATAAALARLGAVERRALPVHDFRAAIISAVYNHGVVVVVGDTGSGKTTQIPQYLHEAGFTAGGGVVACTQPRRVAATELARRVAQEVGCELGSTVGYAVRFQEATSPATAIKYLTDGMLLRELAGDPLLSRYAVVMVDEAHERGVNSDILLGLLKKVRRRRPELRVVVSSATVDAERLRAFFAGDGERRRRAFAPSGVSADAVATAAREGGEGAAQRSLLQRGRLRPLEKEEEEVEEGPLVVEAPAAAAASGSGRGKKERNHREREASSSGSSPAASRRHRHRSRSRSPSSGRRRGHRERRRRSASSSDSDSGRRHRGSGGHSSHHRHHHSSNRHRRSRSRSKERSKRERRDRERGSRTSGGGGTDRRFEDDSSSGSSSRAGSKSPLRAEAPVALIGGPSEAPAPVAPVAAPVASPAPPPAPSLGSKLADMQARAKAAMAAKRAAAAVGTTTTATTAAMAPSPATAAPTTAAAPPPPAPPPQPSGPDLSSAVTLHVSGRSFPVAVEFLSCPTPDFVSAAVDAVLNIHAQGSSNDGRSGGDGDVLVFLPGAEEIEAAAAQLAADLQALIEEGVLQREGALVLPEGLASASVAQRSAFWGALQPHRLYAAAPADVQAAALAPAAAAPSSKSSSRSVHHYHPRKAIFASSIAETSLTIDGVVFVIDAGWARAPLVHPLTGVDALLTVPASRASAAQRAGRAGRTRPGRCYRLYTAEAFAAAMPPAALPEVQRVDLSPAILALARLGVTDFAHFDWLDPPEPLALARALEQLVALGALESSSGGGGPQLTRPLGVTMADLPLDPKAARFLLEAAAHGCAEAALTAVAVLQVQSIFKAPVGPGSTSVYAARRYAEADAGLLPFASREGDLVTACNVFTAYETKAAGGRASELGEWASAAGLSLPALAQVATIKAQLRRALTAAASAVGRAALAPAAPGESSSPPPRWSLVTDPSVAAEPGLVTFRRCIVAGYFQNAARLGADGGYRTVRGGLPVRLHPSSVYARFAGGPPPPWIVFCDAVLTSSTSEDVLVRDVTAIDPRWLLEAAPAFFEVGLSDLDARAAEAAATPIVLIGSSSSGSGGAAPGRLVYQSASARAAAAAAAAASAASSRPAPASTAPAPAPASAPPSGSVSAMMAALFEGNSGGGRPRFPF